MITILILVVSFSSENIVRNWQLRLRASTFQANVDKQHQSKPSFFNSNKTNICRTHRVPTYPWYFLLLLLLLGPVSDFYSKSLIYHIQASGSPQPIHFLKAHDVSYPNTDENTNTKTKTVTETMTKTMTKTITKTKTPRE